MMQRRQHKMICVLLCVAMMFAGPLHAQVMFFCNTLAAVVHEECCCDDHEVDRHRDCEQCVERQFEQYSSDFLKPGDTRLDTDTSLTISAIELKLLASLSSRTVDVPANVAACNDSSQTYLITRRIRI